MIEHIKEKLLLTFNIKERDDVKKINVERIMNF